MKGLRESEQGGFVQGSRTETERARAKKREGSNIGHLCKLAAAVTEDV